MSQAIYPQPPRAGSTVAYLMLLPVEIARFTRPKHRLVSVALIRALRQAAVSCYGALWSPDFPREQIVPAIVVANFAGAHCININQKQPQKKYKCYATAIMSPSVHSDFVTSDKATLSRG